MRAKLRSETNNEGGLSEFLCWLFVFVADAPSLYQLYLLSRPECWSLIDKGLSLRYIFEGD